MTAMPTQTVTLVEPLPGFADDLQFTLNPIDQAGLLRSLRSVRDPGLRFVVTAAGTFFAEYHDTVRAALAAPMGELLGGEGADIELYLVLTVGASLADTTANLRAPLVVEPGSGRAVQVILDDEELPMRHPLTGG